MEFSLGHDEYIKFINHFGSDTYKNVMNRISLYSLVWELNDIKMIDYYSVNSLFTCRSEIYGDCVLKVCNTTRREVISEINALREFGGVKFCRLYDYDIENETMLVERLLPGEQLKGEVGLEKRLSVFSDLFNDLHQVPSKPSLYGTYTSWVCRIAEYMKNIPGHEELTEHMQKARDIYLEVASAYNSEMLLHGDFHYDNILLNDGHYKIIDPKGVVGDPVFDVPRYTLNEYCDADDISHEGRVNLIKKVIGHFQKSLEIPVDIQKKSFYVEMAMSQCWNVESGFEPNIEDVRFAESLLKIL